MWSSDNVYAKQNGGEYEWELEGTEGVPTSQDFWSTLISNSSAWLSVYEQDWLFTEYVGATHTMLESPTMPREWLLQMGKGASENRVKIQYCMLWPRFALQSLEVSAVTTARASTDYAAGRNDQWVMGAFWFCWLRHMLVLVRQACSRECHAEFLPNVAYVRAFFAVPGLSRSQADQR